MIVIVKQHHENSAVRYQAIREVRQTSAHLKLVRNKGGYLLFPSEDVETCTVIEAKERGS